MMRVLLSRHLARRVHAGLYRRAFSLPSHEVVGMPALSPTMEVGTILSWNKGEGDLVSSGETIAEIETDKATITFDAVDDSYVAKILVTAGSEVKVGDPILVTVEEKSDVSAFVDFKVSGSNDNTASQSRPEVAPPPPPPTPPPQVAQKQEQPPPPPPPIPKAEISRPPPPLPTTSSPTTASSSSTWGTHILSSSPLLARVIKEQQDYVEKYGNSCHIPLSHQKE